MPDTMSFRKQDGSIIKAQEVFINSTSEHWSEFMLEDGAVVKAKIVGTKVFKVPGEYDGDGNPLYLLRSVNVVAVTVPEALKRKILDTGQA
jgi:hypothetical protein